MRRRPYQIPHKFAEPRINIYKDGEVFQGIGGRRLGMQNEAPGQADLTLLANCWVNRDKAVKSEENRGNVVFEMSAPLCPRKDMLFAWIQRLFTKHRPNSSYPHLGARVGTQPCQQPPKLAGVFLSHCAKG